MNENGETLGLPSTFDRVGRPIQLTAAEIREHNLVALAALDVVDLIGDAAYLESQMMNCDAS